MKKKRWEKGRKSFFFSNYNSCKIDQNLLDPLDKTKFIKKKKLNCHVVRSEMNIWIYKCFSFCTAAIVTVVIVKNNFFSLPRLKKKTNSIKLNQFVL